MLTVLLVIVIGLAVLALVNFLIITYRGQPVPVPAIPRGTQTLGSGEPLKYAVVGDSTAVGQGADYEQGIAVSTARFMAARRQVTLQNYGASGARLNGVLRDQVEAAARMEPDVVLVSAGANDVTHLTALSDIERDLVQIIDRLRAANPNVEIILTGAPAMGAVPRFPQPTRFLAGVRTESVNRVFVRVASRYDKVTFAPIAAKTGPMFKQRPALFAADKFHPNADGYGTWLPVLEESITRALPAG